MGTASIIFFESGVSSAVAFISFDSFVSFVSFVSMVGLTIGSIVMEDIVVGMDCDGEDERVALLLIFIASEDNGEGEV